MKLKDKFMSLAELGGNSPIIKSFYNEIVVREYSPTEIPIGITEYDELLTIDFSESQRLLIFGSTGSGKSWLTRSIMNRFYLSGFDVCVLTDIKPEYHYSLQPAPMSWKKKGWFLKDEYPTSIPTTSFYPLFLQKLTHQNFKNQHLAQISLSQLNQYDLLTILGFTSEVQEDLIINAWEEFQELSDKSIENLIYTIQAQEDFPKASLRGIKRKLKKAVETGLIGDSFSDFDFVKEIQARRIPVLSLAGYDMLGEYSVYPSVIVAVVLRQLIQAKKDGRLPKKNRLLIVIDELAKFCPKSDDSPSKREIMQNYDLARQWGISFISTTQYLDKIPDSIFAQSPFIFLPFNIDINIAKEVFKRKIPESYTSIQTFGIEVAERIGEMKYNKKTKQRDWMLIREDTRESVIFKPLAPLTKHPKFV
ncbi:MAG: helicase HerA domain-containing protein [Candidatus Heimdallarchaeaceae archaeon]